MAPAPRKGEPAFVATKGTKVTAATGMTAAPSAPYVAASGYGAPVVVAEPPASIGRRVGAYVIDVVIAGLVGSVSVVGALLLWLPLLAMLAAAQSGASTEFSGLPLLGLALMGIGALLSLGWTIVWVLMQGGRGSVGMRLLKIRLVRQGMGTKIGFWRALGRHVVFGLLAGIIVGYFTPLFDRSGRRQGWHDLMVGAIMVDGPAFDEFLARAAALASAPPPAPTPSPIEELHRDRAFGLPVAPPVVPPLPGMRATAAATAPPRADANAAPVIADVPVHLAMRRAPGEIPSAPAPAAPAATLELRWDDGTVVAVPSAALIGRDPVAAADAARVSAKLAGAASIPVVDDTMSLSKTHFGVGVDRTGAWIVDLHSTNGTALHRAGIAPRALVPGELTGIASGDVAVMGSRQVTFVVVGA